ncbi:hypothetical protein FHW64_005388 [Variovorax sp. Sphag1AA]|nr:hypothetical protein [Variovorax sp. Sphag1AA]
MTSAPHISDRANVTAIWQPDETLYSLLSRHHRLSGNVRPEDTSLELFGQSGLGIAHDLPAHIDLLVSQTAGVLGSPSSLIFERTLLPYFLPLMSASRALTAVASARGQSVASGKAIFGLRHTSLCTSNPLKACRRCMKEDAEGCCFAYWHRDHQWPGAVICPLHNELLVQASGRVYTGKRFDWLLPHAFKFTPCAQSPRERTLSYFQKLAGCACGLGNLPKGFHFALEILSQTYRRRLVETELALQDGRLSHMKFCKYLSAATNVLCGVRGLEILFQRRGSIETLRFERLLYAGHPATHPVLHVILISAVFDSWESFARAYAAECLSVERLCTPP